MVPSAPSLTVTFRAETSSSRLIFSEGSPATGFPSIVTAPRVTLSRIMSVPPAAHPTFKASVMINNRDAMISRVLFVLFPPCSKNGVSHLMSGSGWYFRLRALLSERGYEPFDMQRLAFSDRLARQAQQQRRLQRLQCSPEQCRRQSLCHQQKRDHQPTRQTQ